MQPARRDVADGNVCLDAASRAAQRPSASVGGSAATSAGGRGAEVDAARALRARRRRERRARVPTSRLRSSAAPSAGRACGEQRGGAGDGGSRRARAVDGAEARRPSASAPGSAVATPTPGATRSGFTRPSNARPGDENGATRAAGVRPASRRRRSTRRRRARAMPASSVARPPAGSRRPGPAMSSSSPSAAGGRSRAVEEDRGGARVGGVAATAAAGRSPPATSAARPATRLSPRRSKKSSSGGAVRPTLRRGARHADAEVERLARARPRRRAAASGRERRAGRRGATTRACAVARPHVERRRRSARRARRRGRRRCRSPGRPAPSFPAGATTSVSSASAPAAARASGLSAKPANGSATPTSATRAASCASPSPFGSTARSSPASSWSVRRVHGPVRGASRCQPATRIGSTRRAGRDAGEAGRAARRRRAAGHLRAVRSSCAGLVGLRRGERAGVAADDVDARRSRGRAGTAARRSTPVSSSAIVTPRPSKPEQSMSGRRRRTVRARQDVARERRGIRGAHRIDTRDVGRRARAARSPRASSAAEKPLSVRV